MMTNDDERGGEEGKKCPKFDDVILCERPHMLKKSDKCVPFAKVYRSTNSMKIKVPAFHVMLPSRFL